MSYITLTYSPPPAYGFPYAIGVEKTLASWGVTSCTRDAQNMAQDDFGLNIATAATGPDIFAYGGQILIQLGRVGVAFGADGQPTSFSGGRKWAIGYRQRELKSASGRMQSYQYKFAGIWAFFMEHHVFQKFQMQWNGQQGSGAGLVMQPASQISLGQSIATLTEANGQQTTNMTIAQQVAEIVQFTIAQTIAEYSGGVNGNPLYPTYTSLPLQANTNCDVVIANYIINNPGSALFALDTLFTTDSNYNVVGLNGFKSPLNGSGAAGGWLGYCPMDAANDLTCAEALKKTLKIVPGVSMWFDFCPTIGAAATSPIPVLHIATKDTLPNVTLPWGNSSTLSPYGHRTSKIDRRDDLIPPCVDYKYKVTTTANGQSFIAIYDDIACARGATGNANTLDNPGQATIQLTGGPLIYAASNPVAYNAALAVLLPQSERFRAEVATFDFDGGSSTSTTLTTLPIPFNPTGTKASPNADMLTWIQVLVSSLSLPNVGQDMTVTPNTSVALTLTDGVTAAAAAYQWFMIGGPVPAGLYDNQGNPQGVQLTLTCSFDYAENPALSQGANTVKTEVKSVSVYGFTSSSATYGSITSLAEPVPFGLAQYVYNIETIPQYDGSHGIVEADPQTKIPTVTDACPIGTNLCIAIPTTDPNYATALAAGIVAQYATMSAQVQTVTYDLMKGYTDITFGVAAHLGGKEMIERLRINRGPRWLYSINPTLTNAGAGGSGNLSGPTQLKDTQQVAPVPSFIWMPPSTTTVGIPGGSVTAPGGTGTNAGITIDLRTANQPNYGASGNTLNVPLIFIASSATALPNAPLKSFARLDAAAALTLQQNMAAAYASSAIVNANGSIVLDQAASTTVAAARIQAALSDLAGATTNFSGLIRCREYPCCYDFGDGNGPVAAFVVLLGSVPYKTTLGAPLAGPW